MRYFARLGLLAFTGMVFLSAAGCKDGGDSKSPSNQVIPSGSASAPAFSRTAAPATTVASGPAPTSEPTAEPSAEPAPAESAEPEAPEEAPLPAVDVKNVGMHIGGEANTAAQKRPIRAAVAKYYDDMKRCYAKAESPKKGATFGVDMRIDGKGGKPKVTNPRSALKGPGVKECLVEVFEGIEFPKQPKGAPRMVSFSIEFRKK